MIDATPLLRAFASRRLEQLDEMDPAETQLRTLGVLLRRAASTRFGWEHGFAEIEDVHEYQSRVPLRRYEDFWREYWEPRFPLLENVTWPGLITAFAQSSGTTDGVTKRIPVSRAMVRANSGAAMDALAYHLRARPDSRIFGGRNLFLGGSTSLERLAPGVYAGDLSGIAAARMPAWARTRSFPPRDLALIGNWEKKVAALAPAALAQDIRSISGTPSWMLLFFERLAALRPGRPRRLAEYWPGLELIVHGGVAFTPYADAMAAWLEGSHAETREIYAASEGFIAAADRGPGDGMRLVLDRGLFYEFVRPDALDSPNPDRHWLGTAELDVDYALVISSNAGLWSYVIGDTVRLVDLHPPRLVVTGRTSFTLSAFGEHVAAHELDTAVAEAARSLGATVTDYAAAAIHPSPERARGGHIFFVELSNAAKAPSPAGGRGQGESATSANHPHPNLGPLCGPSPPAGEGATLGEKERFASVVDQRLAGMNADYADHRSGDFGMAPPIVVLLPPGTFEAWMRRRGKLGGQNKVPRVINDPRLLEDLRGFVGL